MFKYLILGTVYKVLKEKNYFKFSSNSEANASELLENIEEYYITTVTAWNLSSESHVSEGLKLDPCPWYA